MTCGIYQIINKTNGKSYVGLSRNIKRRWRQHTGGLDKQNALKQGNYPLRAAFIKHEFARYPERFEFKIIEECEESLLIERENYWIKSLKPEYNSPIYNPPRTSQARKTPPGEGVWIQYHNCDKLGYLPAESISISTQEDYENALSGVSTGKRAILNAKGDTVFLIAGIGKNPKQYYLISRFVIEEVQTRSDTDPYQKGEMFYDAYGDGWVLHPPQLLNSEEFNKFRLHCGSFGFGFMSVRNSPYIKTLRSLSEQHRPEKLTYAKYIESFYRSVITVNPKERSALAGRGVALHLLISLSLPCAALVLTGKMTKLVLISAESFVDYRGLLFIHSLNFEEADFEWNGESVRENYLSLLSLIGANEKTFLGQSILGFVNVKDIYAYTPETFAADCDQHLHGTDLENLKAYFNVPDGEVWCIEVDSPKLLSKAIQLTTPLGIQGYDCWEPLEELEIKALRLALEDVFTLR